MLSTRRPFLVTGSAGFIGAALVQRLLQSGETVVGIDNLNSYYDPLLKRDRLNEIEKTALKCSGSWSFYETSLENKLDLKKVFNSKEPDVVVNLAAQAGVRYSLENPSSYLQSNLVGFGNVLEECRSNKVSHLVYASSSSVYGGNHNLPFS